MKTMASLFCSILLVISTFPQGLNASPVPDTGQTTCYDDFAVMTDLRRNLSEGDSRGVFRPGRQLQH